MGDRLDIDFFEWVLETEPSRTLAGEEVGNAGSVRECADLPEDADKGGTVKFH